MRKPIVTLVASLALAQFPNEAFAQQAAPAAWSGWARCQVTVQGPGYTDQQTHTWTISGGAPTAQGAFQIYAGTWDVVGGGSLSRSQGAQTLTAQWATNAAGISAPIAVFVRASDNRMFIQARHAQLRSRSAIQGYQQQTIAGRPQTPGKIDAEAFEWAFPVVAVSAPVAPDTNATATGSSVSPVNGGVGIMQPGGSQGTASCTWQFGQGSAAPAPPPTLTAQAVPTPGNPSTTSPTPNNPPGTSTPPANTGARLVSISPAIVEQGAIGTIVTLTGQGTHWSRTQPTITVSPGFGAPRIDAQATSDTELLSSFDVQYGTAPGPRTITVTAGSEVVTLPNAFTVTARARPELVSVTPLRARQGDRNLTVQMTGRNTRWAQGATRVQLARSSDASQPGTAAPMPGVTVVSTTVHSPTSASAVLNVEANAVVGAYWFQVFDAAPSDWLKIVDGFTVESASTTQPPAGGSSPAASRLVSVAPSSVEQGVSVSGVITLTGEGTHWQQGTTTVNFGPGITNQGGAQVLSPTSLTTQLTVSYAAASGPRAVTVTTGNETVTLPTALTITAREQPVIMQISPDNAAAGAQNVTVTFTGRGTRWEQGKTALLLHNATGVTQASALRVTSPTSMTVSLNIASSAAPGPREITVLNSGVVVGSDIITLAGGFNVSGPLLTAIPIDPQLLPLPQLAGQITVIAPNGGETLAAGRPGQILWRHTVAAGLFDIDISTDRGATWSVLASRVTPRRFNQLPEAGGPDVFGDFYSMPSTSTSTAQIRVRASGQATPNDVSDATFNLAIPAAQVIKPVAGERWKIGSKPSPEIAWTHNLGANGNFWISLSRDGGQTWEVINGWGLNSSGTWHEVSGPPTTRAIIQIRSSDSPSVVAESARFAIGY
jgi:hypothetical protein